MGPKNPSTAASSNQQDMYSSRGFGDLGSTKKTGEHVRLTNEQELSSDDDVNERQEDELISCPNCQEEMPHREAAAHTVQCYRNSTKCKVCGKVILKSKKKEHLMRWRDPNQLLEAIENDHEDQVSLHFDHGVDCNMQYKEEQVPAKNVVPDVNN